MSVGLCINCPLLFGVMMMILEHTFFFVVVGGVSEVCEDYVRTVDFKDNS